MAPPEISQVVCSAQTAIEGDPNYDASKDPKRKPTKSKDPGWKYAFWPDLENKYTLQCILCGKKVPSGVTRFKKHLAGGFAIVEKCPKTTAEIRKQMHDYLRAHGQKFTTIDLDARGEGEEGDEEEEAAASSKASNTSRKRKTAATSSVASEPKKQTKSIADEIRKTPEEVVAERHRLKSVQKTMKDYIKKTKAQKDIVDS